MKVFGDLRSCFSFRGETAKCPLRWFYYGCVLWWCGTWKVVRCVTVVRSIFILIFERFFWWVGWVCGWVVPWDSLSRLLWLLFGCVVWWGGQCQCDLCCERALTCHKAWEKVTSKKKQSHISVISLSYLSVALSHWPFSAHHVRGALCVTRLAEIRLLCGLLWAGPLLKKITAQNSLTKSVSPCWMSVQKNVDWRSLGKLWPSSVGLTASPFKIFFSTTVRAFPSPRNNTHHQPTNQ